MRTFSDQDGVALKIASAIKLWMMNCHSQAPRTLLTKGAEVMIQVLMRGG